MRTARSGTWSILTAERCSLTKQPGGKGLFLPEFPFRRERHPLPGDGCLQTSLTPPPVPFHAFFSLPLPNFVPWGSFNYLSRISVARSLVIKVVAHSSVSVSKDVRDKGKETPRRRLQECFRASVKREFCPIRSDRNNSCSNNKSGNKHELANSAASRCYATLLTKETEENLLYAKEAFASVRPNYRAKGVPFFLQRKSSSGLIDA